jgi:hypothetical protein
MGVVIVTLASNGPTDLVRDDYYKAGWPSTRTSPPRRRGKRWGSRLRSPARPRSHARGGVAADGAFRFRDPNSSSNCPTPRSRPRIFASQAPAAAPGRWVALVPRFEGYAHPPGLSAGRPMALEARRTAGAGAAAPSGGRAPTRGAFAVNTLSATAPSVAPPCSAAAEGCYHCGLPVPPGHVLTVPVDNRAEPVCCHGCEAAYHWLQDQGLDRYYALRQRASGSAPRPRCRPGPRRDCPALPYSGW